MSLKYYAVKKGRKTGIFTSWEECQNSVSGYANAIYKSFVDINDAKQFLYETKGNANKSESELQAYIDGSYDDNIKKYSYAIILFYNDKKITYAQSESNSELVELRNVAGELKAAIFVMEYALNNNIKSIDIFYDYNGIEMWATGAWKANTPFTREYSEYASKILKKIKIRFVKIKSHTGNKYNDEVDKLAKEALYKEDILDINNNEETKYSYPLGLIDNLKKTKASLDLCSFTWGNKIITSKDVYNKFKNLWKDKKRLLTEIDGLKSYFDIERLSFVIVVYTKNDESILVIRGDEIDG